MHYDRITYSFTSNLNLIKPLFMGHILISKECTVIGDVNSTYDISDSYLYSHYFQF